MSNFYENIKVKYIENEESVYISIKINEGTVITKKVSVRDFEKMIADYKQQLIDFNLEK